MDNFIFEIKLAMNGVFGNSLDYLEYNYCIKVDLIFLELN